MANAYNYSNVAVPTTLAGNISAGATTVSVVSTVGFPTVPFVMAIDYGASTEELMKVTSVAGLALTGTRGFGGTSAQSHSLGAAVRPVYNAVDATDFRTHEDSVTMHGATGAVVGTTNTQTLTNKTLTSPAINSATITGGTMSGTIAGQPDFSDRVDFQNGISTTDDAAGVPLRVVGGPAQTASLLLIENNAGTDLVRVDASGTTLFDQGVTLNSTLGVTGLTSLANVQYSGTLTAPSAGSVVWNNALGGFNYAYKPSATTRTSSTTDPDPHLSVNLVNGSTYLVEALFVVGGDPSIDIRFAWSGSHTGWWAPINYGASSSGSSNPVEIVASAWTAAARSFGLDSTFSYGIQVRGTLTATSTGAFTANWGTNTNGISATLREGSHLRIQRIA